MPNFNFNETSLFITVIDYPNERLTTLLKLDRWMRKNWAIAVDDDDDEKDFCSLGFMLVSRSQSHFSQRVIKFKRFIH